MFRGWFVGPRAWFSLLLSHLRRFLNFPYTYYIHPGGRSVPPALTVAPTPGITWRGRGWFRRSGGAAGGGRPRGGGDAGGRRRLPGQAQAEAGRQGFIAAPD